MIYLDNAATGGSKPLQVQNAVLSSLKLCANPGRSGHRLALACAEHVLECRKLLSRLFDGYGYERVVFTKSCTEALNLAILGVLEEGDHVVYSVLEHNSVLRPLQTLIQSGKIAADAAPLQNGTLLPETVASLVKPNTRMCCITAASNVTGQTVELKRLRALLPEKVLLVADGAQAAGHVPIRMREWGIDALALAGHKGLYAMQGAGCLLFSERMDPAPLLFGGTGSESHSLDMPAYYPDRLESGTISYPAVCSLFEGALYAQTHLEENGAALFRLTEAFAGGLSSLRGWKLYSAPNRCGIAAFAHEKLPSETVAQRLSDKFDIAVRGGLHCAPLAHRALGTFPDGLVRASFSPDQSLREVRALLSALKRIGATSA